MLQINLVDSMVIEGYVAAGYNIVAVDDGWQSPNRDPTSGSLISDPNRFPSGIKALADYVLHVLCLYSLNPMYVRRTTILKNFEKFSNLFSFNENGKILEKCLCINYHHVYVLLWLHLCRY